jgi:hypothetical protein
VFLACFLALGVTPLAPPARLEMRHWFRAGFPPVRTLRFLVSLCFAFVAAAAGRLHFVVYSWSVFLLFLSRCFVCFLPSVFRLTPETPET